jgi:hypothetical protein
MGHGTSESVILVTTRDLKSLTSSAEYRYEYEFLCS